MNNSYYTVCGIVEIGGKILLVRHTYGTAKGRILLPGGYVLNGELAPAAAEREILEETGVHARAEAIAAVQFKPEQWCVVFHMRYLSGTPRSDGMENSEVLLLDAEEAIHRADITNMSREILSAYRSGGARLNKGSYLPASVDPNDYAIFGVK